MLPIQSLFFPVILFVSSLYLKLFLFHYCLQLLFILMNIAFSCFLDLLFCNCTSVTHQFPCVGSAKFPDLTSSYIQTCDSLFELMVKCIITKWEKNVLPHLKLPDGKFQEEYWKYVGYYVN